MNCRYRGQKSSLERDAAGEVNEPIEEVVIDVDEQHSGIVVQKLSERKAEMIEMRPSGGGRVRLVFYAPTRGLIGYQGELLTDTRGTAVMNRLFHCYDRHRGEIAGRRNGVLISNDAGEAVAYALWNLEDRGPMMIEPGCKVYRGMIIGEHTRGNDLEVNVLKGKKLTNIRTHSKDEAVRLTPPIQLAARAQQTVPVTAFVWAGQTSSGGSMAPYVAAFRQGLREVGFVEGQNVTVEYGWMGGEGKGLPALMAELVQRQVAVIVGNTPPAIAARKAT